MRIIDTADPGILYLVYVYDSARSESSWDLAFVADGKWFTQTGRRLWAGRKVTHIYSLPNV